MVNHYMAEAISERVIIGMTSGECQAVPAKYDADTSIPFAIPIYVIVCNSL
jgi:hypothetical protein